MDHSDRSEASLAWFAETLTIGFLYRANTFVGDYFPGRAARHARMRHADEQYWRSLRPLLRRNRRWQFGAGHFVQWLMPAASLANCYQVVSINSVGR